MNKVHGFRSESDFRLSQTPLICSPAQMELGRQTFDPAGAGALLVTGPQPASARARWPAGRPDPLESASAIGAMIGIPVAIFAVYRTYRGAF